MSAMTMTGGGDDRLPIRIFRIPSEQPGANQAAAPEKVAEMHDLVQMRDRRDRTSLVDSERREYPKQAEPEQEAGEPEIRMPGKPRMPQSLRISSSSRSASHCFIIDW